MKQFIELSLLAALSACISSTATAAGLIGFDAPTTESNFSFNNGVKMYVGGNLGYVNHDSSCNTPFFEGDCEAGSVSWKVFGGARFNPMFGVEAAYAHQGDASLKGRVGDQAVASTNEVAGYQLTGVAYLPLGNVPNLELVGKAGAMFWERDSEVTLGNSSQLSEDEGIAPLIGLGAQYQLNQNIYLRSEWEHTFNTGADSEHETDTDNYSVGLMYSTL